MSLELTQRCVIYVRVSSVEQTKNLSLETQQEICARYAAGKDWVIDRLFIEPGESAKTAKRTELQRLIDYCRAHRGRVQYVLVYSVNRYMRNAEEHLALRGVLARMGVMLRSATETLDETPAGRYVETILAAGAEYENRQRSDRTVTGMKAAIERGRWPYKAPVGYLNARTSDQRPTFVHDPERAPLVRKAFELAAMGSSPVEILRDLQARGFTTRKGSAFGPKHLAELLRNPVYAGILRVAAWKVEGKAAFPPIVDEETFRAARAALYGRPVATEAPATTAGNPDFPLRGFVRCTDGRKLVGYWAAGRGGKRYAYYECPACRARARRDDLEDAFVALVDQARPTPAMYTAFQEAVLDEYDETRERAVSEQAALRRQLEAIRERKGRLVEARIYERAIDQETFEGLIAKLNEEHDAAQAGIGQARVLELDADALLGYAERVIMHAGSLWRSSEPQQREALQRFLFDGGLKWGRLTGFHRTAIRGFEFNEIPDADAQKSGLVDHDRFGSNRAVRFLLAAARLREVLPVAA